MKLTLSLLYLFISSITYSQSYKILQSDQQKIKIEFNFSGKYELHNVIINGKTFQKIKGDDFTPVDPGKPWLPQLILNLGIPSDSKPLVKILSVEKEIIKNQFIIPFPKDDPEMRNDRINKSAGNEEWLDPQVYSTNNLFPADMNSLAEPFLMRYIRVASLSIYPFQFNPVTRDLIFNKKIILEVHYNNTNMPGVQSINDPMTSEYIIKNLINASEAANWVGRNKQAEASSEPYWYNPQKNYYKLFLNKEGVYRITYQYLVSAGIPLVNVPLANLELFNNGEFIPLDVTDVDKNNIFNQGDYFEFIGKPVAPTKYIKQNIYNTTNVYWFSYEGESSGVFYDSADGYAGTWFNDYQINLRTVHYEKDLIYERLGYAPDEKRDYWFWGEVTAQSGTSSKRFEQIFKGFTDISADSLYVTVRVNMHGMTNDYRCPVDHNAMIYINNKLIGNAEWDGQTEFTFEKRFYVSPDSNIIYPEANDIKVVVNGDACSASRSDIIRVNWFEFDYWGTNRTNGEFAFKSPPGVLGKTRFWIWPWANKSVKIFVPQKNRIYTNYAFDEQYKAVLFIDSISEQTDYYMIAENTARLVPDSISQDTPSDYRNVTNAADYIIITHPSLMSVAKRLEEYRLSNFPDTSITNPRIFIADVFEIYDEFANGFLNPFALQDFVKYAFEKWQQPSPAYVVLLGDMSWDYRQLLAASKQNFVPSIPVHASSGGNLTYGQAVSDNRIVAVSGNDPYPDLAVGRLSCETIEEGNVLIDKIINYATDDSKEWKQNVLLVSSGQNLADENSFGFNDENMLLDRLYVNPLGITSDKIFRYPNRPEYNQYQGDGPEIREGFNKGAVMANYYGHGGGAQWDLVFLNDDIYLLNNKDRLPVVTSTTCYTAHFDNQDVFGEHFIKVPDKGAIGFIGSSGLTLWGAGKYYNILLYQEVFGSKTYNIGKALLNASGKYIRGTEYDLQLALFTYLGDPLIKLAFPEKPDFAVQTNDISISPSSPIVGDSVDVKIKIKNFGIVFDDSLSIQLFASSADTSYEIGTKKLSSFGELDSLNFSWFPASGGLYEITVRVNEIDMIDEDDRSDNSATASFAVYNITEPNIIYPEKGLSTTAHNIDFLFSDIGHYLDKELLYVIEIDTSLNFASPLVQSDLISPADGLLNWNSPQLLNGEYFWRSRIYDGENYGNWSAVRGLTITSAADTGYVSQGNLLKLYNTYNIKFSNELNSLVLNTELLPPKPDRTRFLGDIWFSTSGIENLGLTTITTDGRYIYFANIWYYSLRHNPQGYTKIHKLGTGENGTVRGQYYGTIPNFNDKIVYQMFYHSDGFIYAANGNAYTLIKINPETGDTSSVIIPVGMLENETARVQDGAIYITSDGKYVYNLALRDTLGNHKYVLRTFDPSNNWSLVKPDMVLSGSSFYGAFTGFFVAAGYLYPLENFNLNYMRRIRLEDGLFEEEWIMNESVFQNYYALCYDWSNNLVYASVFKSTGVAPKFSIFKGSYADASGSITSEMIGPAFKWNNLSYKIDTEGSSGSYNVTLKGLNQSTKQWDVLRGNLPQSFPLNNFSASEYPFMQVVISLTESATINSNPLKMQKLNLKYETVPEVVLTKKDFTFSPDTLLQGFNTEMNLSIKNLGGSAADSLQVKFYLNNADTSFYSTNVKVEKQSTALISYEIPTSKLLFENKIKSIVNMPSPEFYTYNNIIENSFFVARDSIKPEFQVTFDGNEIINEDIISATPHVMITLKDNSPLPLDTSYFTIVHNGVPLRFARDDIEYSYSPYPNSQFNVEWKPMLEDGRHTLEILAKDASGNFFDSTSSRTIFNVYNNDDLLNIYNYPNPFENDTYFTFELRGTNIPEEFIFKIFTIAGRLIRDISIPSSDLRIGFNKIYWDGRDQDGDEIANGLYFYKIISKINGQVKTEIKKLAKVK